MNREITKSVAWWFFDYVIKPLVFLLVLLGIEATLTMSDGKKITINKKGEKWHWLREGFVRDNLK